jgi:hypothetical protein
LPFPPSALPPACAGVGERSPLPAAREGKFLSPHRSRLREPSPNAGVRFYIVIRYLIIQIGTTDMHVTRRRHSTSSTILGDLVFWLAVMTCVIGLAALMWSTATGGLAGL